MSRAEAALAYASHGWPIVPLHHARGGRCSCPNVHCDRVAKHPRTANGFHDASADPATVTAWWARWPEANIGFSPGRAGLLVIDVDGPRGEAAAQAMGLLAEPTLEVLTGRGRHLWFRHPGGVIGNVDLGDELDVRADHGFVLLPPSVHATGRVYRWAGRVEDVADLPPGVAARLRPPVTSTEKMITGEMITEGGRNVTLTRIAGALRRHGCAEATIVAAIAVVNTDRCRPPLEVRELERIAASVARYAPMHTTPGPRALAGGWERFA